MNIVRDDIRPACDRRRDRWTAPRVGLLGCLLALGSGCALGIVSRLGDWLPPALAWLVNIGGPWLALAFALGALTRSVCQGALYGALALIGAVVGYYGWMHIVERQANLAYLTSIAAVWFAVAIVGGAVFGTAGASWRARRWWRGAIGVALLSGALAGESLLLLPRPYNITQKGVFVVELTAALLLPWVLLRERRSRIMALLFTIGGTIIASGVIVGIKVVFRVVTG